MDQNQGYHEKTHRPTHRFEAHNITPLTKIVKFYSRLNPSEETHEQWRNMFLAWFVYTVLRVEGCVMYIYALCQIYSWHKYHLLSRKPSSPEKVFSMHDNKANGSTCAHTILFGIRGHTTNCYLSGTILSPINLSKISMVCITTLYGFYLGFGSHTMKSIFR